MQRVVLVPGFTQTSESWLGVLDGLAGAALQVVALDVPDRATFAASAAAIGDAGGPAVYVGYSMGGRLCLQLAVDRPDIVEGLILVSATPGIDDAGDRAARVASDEALAREVEGRGVEAFLARWLAQPMFAGVAADAPGVADRARLSARFLAHCLRVLGTGAMTPLWDRLAELPMPIALVTGEQDQKFDAIALAMAARLAGDVVHVRVPGGHAVPLEQPAALAGVVREFVAAHGATTR